MRVGILGGGQLAVMLAEALTRLGGRVAVYDPDPEAPASHRVADFVRAPWEDAAALAAFCTRCDVLTYEREDLPVDRLRAAAPEKPFVPDLNVLSIAQDRVAEKAFLDRNGLHPVRHRVVAPDASLAAAAVAFGLPAIAKVTRGGYDGRGQFGVRSENDAADAQREVPAAAWVLEEPIAIVAELSALVARVGTETVTFPIVENHHRDHILDRSVVPSRLPSTVVDAARTLGTEVARAIGLRGLLGVEFFVTRDETSGTNGFLVDGHRLLVNELAPRPHNSGHLLSRACTFGQFDALARILLEVPLGKPVASPGSFCMANLLGDVWAAQGRKGMLDLAPWQAYPDVVDVQIYGKSEPAPRRKMGHFVVQGATAEETLARAEAFRNALRAAKPG